MGLLDRFQDAIAWGKFVNIARGSLSSAFSDFASQAGHDPSASSVIAASTAAASAGIDILNATMRAGLALGALGSGASLAAIEATLKAPLNGLAAASFIGNYAVDATRLAHIYATEGYSERFESGLLKFAAQNAAAAAFGVGALALGSGGILGAFAVAGIGYVVGGMIFELWKDPSGVIPAFIWDPFDPNGPGGKALKLLSSSLEIFLRDPLILDLDGDGIELTALGVAGQAGASNIYFDYDRDGFSERTGWVSADDGMLAFDANNNGLVDGIGELFGSPSQDGYAVLETLDTIHDGVIDAADREFAKLRVWRDLNRNGVTDAGELQTLAEAGIASISLTRSDVTGTNAGHDRGFQGLFTRTNGTTGAAETIYFQTDRRTTQDNTPGFTPAAGVDNLPQLPGSGQIHSIAYKATNDAAFRADWTALTDNAAALTPDAFRAQFDALLLRWAGVENVAQGSRGAFVDAQHLAFVEKFFGDTYREIQSGQQNATSPSQQMLGNSIEGSYQGIVSLLSLAFLAQSVQSGIARGGDIGVALNSPYLFYALLDFRTELAEGEEPSPTPGNLGVVADLIKSSAPENFGEAVGYCRMAA